jgi:hypothetical protein
MFLTIFALAAAVQQCRTYDTALPRQLSGWTRNGAMLDTGHATTLRAGRDNTVRTTVRIRRPATFGIALDQPGWIDVSPQRGKTLASAAHGHGPSCSTIRKIVRYKLRPGTYRVVVSRLKADRARLMLVRY